jgi:hypothetical protein
MTNRMKKKVPWTTVNIGRSSRSTTSRTSNILIDRVFQKSLFLLTLLTTTMLGPRKSHTVKRSNAFRQTPNPRIDSVH